MPGYCTDCRRIKQVTLTRPYTGGTPTGVCLACEERKRDQERLRRVNDRLTVLARRDDGDGDFVQGYRENMQLLRREVALATDFPRLIRALEHRLASRQVTLSAIPFNDGGTAAVQEALVVVREEQHKR